MALTREEEKAAFQKGVEVAVTDFLLEHPHSVGDIIEDAIQAAFSQYLNSHSDIAEAIREGLHLGI